VDQLLIAAFPTDQSIESPAPRISASSFHFILYRIRKLFSLRVNGIFAEESWTPPLDALHTATPLPDKRLSRPRSGLTLYAVLLLSGDQLKWRLISLLRPPLLRYKLSSHQQCTGRRARQWWSASKGRYCSDKRVPAQQCSTNTHDGLQVPCRALFSWNEPQRGLCFGFASSCWPG